METAIGAAIAIITGLAAVTGRIHSRISEVDKRLDAIELRLAEKYMSRDEIYPSLRYFQEYTVRIESKIDRHLALSNMYEGSSKPIQEPPICHLPDHLPPYEHKP